MSRIFSTSNCRLILIPQVDRAIWIMLVAGTTLGVNWFGVKVSQRFNLFSVAIQLAILALLVLLSLVALYHGKGNGALTLRPLYAPELFHAKNIFAATSICVMSFLGFDAISTLAEEVTSDDKRIVGWRSAAIGGDCTEAHHGPCRRVCDSDHGALTDVSNGLVSDADVAPFFMW
jgi:amino acid transporter